MRDAIADGRWWTDRTLYECYVPSFNDSDGDGWGDLRGIIERLDHLEELGVGLLWLTPIHPTPFADHGYDVADYLDVDPRFGTLADVDELVARADRRGIGIVLDIVANHTSDRHPWFQDALTGRDADHRGYYIWRDPAPGGGPPNNWVSAFGGSAWRWHDPTGQYFLHLFAPEQPDLNWDDARVGDEFDAILRFWLDRGVAGFRFDVAHMLVKDPTFADNPRLDTPPDTAAGRPGARREWDLFEHRHDLGRPEALDIHRRWRRVTAAAHAFLLGEVSVRDPRRLAGYVPEDGLHSVFAFPMAETTWEPDRIAGLVRRLADAGPGFVWAHSSHDRSRAVTRFGGGSVGRRRALVLAALTVGLPHLPLIFQGEELGLDDATLAPDDAQDPFARHTPGAFVRDVVRTPMPWSTERGLGFTANASAWIGFGSRARGDTVAHQEHDPASPLRLHRDLLRTRQRFPDLRRGDGANWLGVPPPLIGYRRGECVVIANLGPGPAIADVLSGEWEPVFATGPTDLPVIPGETAVILARP